MFQAFNSSRIMWLHNRATTKFIYRDFSKFPARPEVEAYALYYRAAIPSLDAGLHVVEAILYSNLSNPFSKIIHPYSLLDTTSHNPRHTAFVRLSNIYATCNSILSAHSGMLRVGGRLLVSEESKQTFWKNAFFFATVLGTFYFFFVIGRIVLKKEVNGFRSSFFGCVFFVERRNFSLAEVANLRIEDSTEYEEEERTVDIIQVTIDVVVKSQLSPSTSSISTSTYVDTACTDTVSYISSSSISTRSSNELPTILSSTEKIASSEFSGFRSAYSEVNGSYSIYKPQKKLQSRSGPFSGYCPLSASKSLKNSRISNTFAAVPIVKNTLASISTSTSTITSSLFERSVSIESTSISKQAIAINNVIPSFAIDSLESSTSDTNEATQVIDSITLASSLNTTTSAIEDKVVAAGVKVRSAQVIELHAAPSAAIFEVAVSSEIVSSVAETSVSDTFSLLSLAVEIDEIFKQETVSSNTYVSDTDVEMDFNMETNMHMESDFAPFVFFDNIVDNGMDVDEMGSSTIEERLEENFVVVFDVASCFTIPDVDSLESADSSTSTATPQYRKVFVSEEKELEYNNYLDSIPLPEDDDDLFDEEEYFSDDSDAAIELFPLGSNSQVSACGSSTTTIATVQPTSHSLITLSAPVPAEIEDVTMDISIEHINQVKKKFAFNNVFMDCNTASAGLTSHQSDQASDSMDDEDFEVFTSTFSAERSLAPSISATRFDAFETSTSKTTSRVPRSARVSTRSATTTTTTTTRAARASISEQASSLARPFTSTVAPTTLRSLTSDSSLRVPRCNNMGASTSTPTSLPFPPTTKSVRHSIFSLSFEGEGEDNTDVFDVDMEDSGYFDVEMEEDEDNEVEMMSGELQWQSVAEGFVFAGC